MLNHVTSHSAHLSVFENQSDNKNYTIIRNNAITFAVSGLNIYACIVGIGLICMIYTSLVSTIYLFNIHIHYNQHHNYIYPSRQQRESTTIKIYFSCLTIFYYTVGLHSSLNVNEIEIWAILRQIE